MLLGLVLVVKHQQNSLSLYPLLLDPESYEESLENLCDAFCVLDNFTHNPLAPSPFKAPSPCAPCNIQRYKAATVSPSAEHHRAHAVSTRKCPHRHPLCIHCAHT